VPRIGRGSSAGKAAASGRESAPMKRRTFLALPLVAVASSASAQVDFEQVVSGRPLRFPSDHGSHPGFRTEWWYATGWVADAAGNAYGVQVTFFRNRPGVAEANTSEFAARQLVLAHAAIADPGRKRLLHDQRAAREGFGLAGAAEETTRVWIGDWSLALAGDAYMARIAAREFTLDLRFTATQSMLLEGDAGVSRKGPQSVQASYYYSAPQLAVDGTIAAGGSTTSVSGTAWLDHEWSSEYLAAEAAGWDWTGINLGDGGAMMAFRIRDKSGGPLWAAGTLRAADGKTRTFSRDQVIFTPLRTWRSPRTGVTYPVAMRVTAGEFELALEPLFDDQELDSRATTGTIYWEGAVRASAAGREAGRGYLELTGYGAPLRF
jgi:predicted secreted hydrolase